MPLQTSGIRGLYLANFVPWDSRRFGEDAITRFGAHAAQNTQTFDTYDRIDDMAHMTAHDLLKEAKLGYSRVTDSLVREIRFGRISRDLAKEVETHFQSEYPADELKPFLSWLGMSNDAFLLMLQKNTGTFYAAPTTGRKGLSPMARAFILSFAKHFLPVHNSD